MSKTITMVNMKILSVVLFKKKKKKYNIKIKTYIHVTIT